MSLSDVFFDDPTYEEPTIALQAEDAEADGVDDAEKEELTEAQEEYIEEKAEEVFGDLEDKGANVAVENWNRIKELSGLAMVNPMMSHLTMAGVALAYGINGLNEQLRYRAEFTVSSKTYDYYSAGVVDGSSNYWKTSSTIRNFAYMGVGLTLGLTSLLAAFGIAGGLNQMLWTFGMLGMGIVEMIIAALRILGYDTYYGKGPKSTDANHSAAVTAMGKIQADRLFDESMGALALISLYGAYEGFAYDGWMMMTAEEKADKFVAWEETISTRAAEIADARETAGLTSSGKAEKEEEDAEEGEEGEEEEGEGEGEDAEEGEEEETED